MTAVQTSAAAMVDAEEDSHARRQHASATRNSNLETSEELRLHVCERHLVYAVGHECEQAGGGAR